MKDCDDIINYIIESLRGTKGQNKKKDLVL